MWLSSPSCFGFVPYGVVLIQPLKVKVDDSYMEQIYDILLNKHDKEEPMRNIFAAVREKTVVSQINELLADFRSKRALGTKSLFFPPIKPDISIVTII